MAADIQALSAKAAELSARIDELQLAIGPLQRDLLAIRRKIEGSLAGRASVAQRSRAVAERNRLICDEALRLNSRTEYVSFSWLQALAAKHGISSRQVGRILKAADIKIER